MFPNPAFARTLLGSPERCEVCPVHAGMAKALQNPIQRSDRNLARRGDLDTDGKTVLRVIDDQAGFHAHAPDTAVAPTSRKVIVGSQRTTVTEGDFQIGLVHLTLLLPGMRSRPRATWPRNLVRRLRAKPAYDAGLGQGTCLAPCRDGI